MSDMDLGEIEGEKLYNPKDVVWVKLSGMWWPAEVQDQATLDPEVTEGLKKHPICVVQFLLEESYLHIKSLDQIYHYNCKKKIEFLKLGFKKYSRTKNEKNVSIWPDVIQEAERRTGGNPDIINDPEIVPATEKQETSSINPGPSGKRSSLPMAMKRGQDSRRSLPAGNARRSSLNGAQSNSSVDNDDNASDGRIKHTFRFINMARIPPIEDDEIRPILVQYKCNKCDLKTINLDRLLLHLKYKHFQVRLAPLAPRPAIPGASKPSKEKKRKEESASPILKRRKKKPIVVNEEQTPPAKKKKKILATPNPLEVSQEAEQILKDWDDDDEEMKEGDKTSPIEEMVVNENTVSEANKESDTALILSDKAGPSNGTKDPVLKNIETQPPKSSSCFDFDDEEPSQPEVQTLKFGQKLPRVISPEKSKSSAADIMSDAHELESFLKEVSVPELPSIPSSFKEIKGGKSFAPLPREREKKSSYAKEVLPLGADKQNVEDKMVAALNDERTQSEEDHFLVEGPLQQSKKRKGSGLTEGAEDGSAGKKPKCHDGKEPSTTDCVKIISDCNSEKVNEMQETNVLELEDKVPDKLDEAVLTVESGDSKVMESLSESVKVEIPSKSKITISELDKQSLIDTLTYSPSSVDTDFSQKQNKKKNSKGLKRQEDETKFEDIVSELDKQSLIETLTHSPTPVESSTPRSKRLKKKHSKKSPDLSTDENTPDSSHIQKVSKVVNTNESGTSTSRLRSNKSRISSHSPTKHSKDVHAHDTSLEEEGPKLRKSRRGSKGNQTQFRKSQPLPTEHAIELLDSNSSPSTPKNKQKKIDKSVKSLPQTGEDIASKSAASIEIAEQESSKIIVKPEISTTVDTTSSPSKEQLDAVTDQNETIVESKKHKSPLSSTGVVALEFSSEENTKKDVNNESVMSSRLRSKSGTHTDVSPSSNPSSPHLPASLVASKMRDDPVAPDSKEDPISKGITKSDRKSKAESNVSLSEWKSDERLQKSSESSKIALQKNEFLEVSKLMPKEMKKDRPKQLVDDDCLTSSIDEKSRGNSGIRSRNHSLKAVDRVAVDEAKKKKSSRISEHALEKKMHSSSQKSKPNVSDSTMEQKNEKLVKESGHTDSKKKERFGKTFTDKSHSLKPDDKRSRFSSNSDKSPSKISYDKVHSRSKRSSRYDDRQLKLESVSLPDVTKDLSKSPTPRDEKKQRKSKRSSELVDSHDELKEGLSKRDPATSVVCKDKTKSGVKNNEGSIKSPLRSSDKMKDKSENSGDNEFNKSKSSSRYSDHHMEEKECVSSPDKSSHITAAVAKDKRKSEDRIDKSYSKRSYHSRDSKDVLLEPSPNSSKHIYRDKSHSKTGTSDPNSDEKHSRNKLSTPSPISGVGASKDYKGHIDVPTTPGTIESRRLSRSSHRSSTQKHHFKSQESNSSPDKVAEANKTEGFSDVNTSLLVDDKNDFKITRTLRSQDTQVKTQHINNKSKSPAAPDAKKEGFPLSGTPISCDDSLSPSQDKQVLETTVGSSNVMGKNDLTKEATPSTSEHSRSKHSLRSQDSGSKPLVPTSSPTKITIDAEVGQRDGLSKDATLGVRIEKELYQNKRSLRSQDIKLETLAPNSGISKSILSSATEHEIEGLPAAGTLEFNVDEERSKSCIQVLHSQDMKTNSQEPSSISSKHMTVSETEGQSEVASPSSYDDKEHPISKRVLRSQDSRSKSQEPTSKTSKKSVPSLNDDKKDSKSKPASSSQDCRIKSRKSSSKSSKSIPIDPFGKNSELSEDVIPGLHDDKEQAKVEHSLSSQDCESQPTEPTVMSSQSIPTSAVGTEYSNNKLESLSLDSKPKLPEQSSEPPKSIGKNNVVSEDVFTGLKDDKEQSKCVFLSQDSEVQPQQSSLHQASSEATKKGKCLEAETPNFSLDTELQSQEPNSDASTTSHSADFSVQSLHSEGTTHSKTVEFRLDTSGNMPAVARVDKSEVISEAPTLSFDGSEDLSREEIHSVALRNQVLEPTCATASVGKEELSEAVISKLGDDEDRSRYTPSSVSSDTHNQAEELVSNQTMLCVLKDDVPSEITVLSGSCSKVHATRRRSSDSSGKNLESQVPFVSPLKNVASESTTVLSKTSLIVSEVTKLSSIKSLPSSNLMNDNAPDTRSEQEQPGTTEQLSHSKANLDESVMTGSSHISNAEDFKSQKSKLGTSHKIEVGQFTNTNDSPDDVKLCTEYVKCTDEIVLPKTKPSALTQDIQILKTCTSDDLDLTEKTRIAKKPENAINMETNPMNVVNRSDDLILIEHGKVTLEAKLKNQCEDKILTKGENDLPIDHQMLVNVPHPSHEEILVASNVATPAKKSRRISSRDLKMTSDNQCKTTNETKREVNKEMLASDEVTPKRSRSKWSSIQDMKTKSENVSECQKEMFGKCKKEQLLDSEAQPLRRSKRSMSREQTRNLDSSSIEDKCDKSEVTVDGKLLSEPKIDPAKSAPLCDISDKAVSLSNAVSPKNATSTKPTAEEQNMSPDLKIDSAASRKVLSLETTSVVLKKSDSEKAQRISRVIEPSIPLSETITLSSFEESGTDVSASITVQKNVDAICVPQPIQSSSTEEQLLKPVQSFPKENVSIVTDSNKSLDISTDIVSCESSNSSNQKRVVPSMDKEVPLTNPDSTLILKSGIEMKGVECSISQESKLTTQSVGILPSDDSVMLKDESVVENVLLPPFESTKVSSSQNLLQKTGGLGGIKPTPSSPSSKNLQFGTKVFEPEAIESKGPISIDGRSLSSIPLPKESVTQSKLVSTSVLPEETKPEVLKGGKTEMLELLQFPVVARSPRASRWDNPFPTKKNDTRPSTPTHSLMASPTKMAHSPSSKVRVEIKSGLGRSCFKSPTPEVKYEGLDAKSIESEVKAEHGQVVTKIVQPTPPKENSEDQNEFVDELSALQAEIASYSESKQEINLPVLDNSDARKKSDSIELKTAKVDRHPRELKTDVIEEKVEQKLQSLEQPVSTHQISGLGESLAFDIPVESIPLPDHPKPLETKVKEILPSGPKTPGLAEAVLLASLLKGEEDDIPTQQGKVALAKKEISKPILPETNNEQASTKSAGLKKQRDSNRGFSNTKPNLVKPAVTSLPQIPKVISSIPLPVSEPSISSQLDSVGSTIIKEPSPIVIPVPPKASLENQVPIKHCSVETPTSRVQVLEVERSQSQTGLVGGIDPSKLLDINDIPFVFAEDLIEEGLIPSEPSSLNTSIVTSNMDTLNTLTESIPNATDKTNVVSSTAVDSEETFALEDLVEEVVEEEPATDATLSGDVVDNNFTIVESREKKVYEARQVRQYFIEVSDDSDPNFDYICSLPLAPVGKTAIGQTVSVDPVLPPAKKIAKVVPIQPKRIITESKLVNLSNAGKLVSGVASVSSSQQIIKVNTNKSGKSSKNITAADLDRQNVQVTSGNISEASKTSKKPLKLRLFKDSKTGSTKFVVQELSKSPCQQLLVNQQLKGAMKSPAATVVASNTPTTKNPSLIQINKNPIVSPKLLSRGASPAILTQRKTIRQGAPSQRITTIPIHRPSRSKTVPEILVSNSAARLPIDHSGLILSNPESSSTNQVVLSGPGNQLLLSSSSNQQAGSKFVSFLMNKPQEPKKAGKDLLEQALTGLDVQNEDAPSMMPTATVVYGVLTDPHQQRPIMTTAVQPTQVILSHDQLLSFQTSDGQSSTVSNSETNR